MAAVKAFRCRVLFDVEKHLEKALDAVGLANLILSALGRLSRHSGSSVAVARDGFPPTGTEVSKVRQYVPVIARPHRPMRSIKLEVDDSERLASRLDAWKLDFAKIDCGAELRSDHLLVGADLPQVSEPDEHRRLVRAGVDLAAEKGRQLFQEGQRRPVKTDQSLFCVRRGMLEHAAPAHLDQRIVLGKPGAVAKRDVVEVFEHHSSKRLVTSFTTQFGKVAAHGPRSLTSQSSAALGSSG